MPDYPSANSINQGARVQPANRIEQLTNRVNIMTANVVSSRERIMSHSQLLGFYSEPKSSTLGIAGERAVHPPMPSDLHSALELLEGEINTLSGGLNVFDT